MSRIVLAFETSCDETAVAILKDGALLSNAVSSQVALHQKYGGVMPEMASRLHAENITIVLEEALQQAKVTLKDITHIAVTRGPGLIGALHVGLQAAKALAALYQIPLIPVHHLAAHIYANTFVSELTFPLLAVVVSGGNTELVFMKKHLEFEIVGQTQDDAIGECYDKVARVLNLGYPGGPVIDRLAKAGKASYPLPSPLNDQGFNFSFSGLKTAVINLIHTLEQKKETVHVENLCASFQKVATDLIATKALRAAKHYCAASIVLGGGVSANSALREKLLAIGKQEKIPVTIPPLWCCTDQAAMIGKLADYLIAEKMFASLNLGVDPSWPIEQFRSF